MPLFPMLFEFHHRSTELIYQAHDSFRESWDVEIYKESELPFGKFEVYEKLCFVNWRYLSYGF